MAYLDRIRSGFKFVSGRTGSGKSLRPGILNRDIMRSFKSDLFDSKRRGVESIVGIGGGQRPKPTPGLKNVFKDAKRHPLSRRPKNLPGMQPLKPSTPLG